MFNLSQKSIQFKLVIVGFGLILMALGVRFYVHSHAEEIKQAQEAQAIKDFIGEHHMQKSYQTQVGEGQ